MAKRVSERVRAHLRNAQSLLKQAQGLPSRGPLKGDKFELLIRTLIHADRGMVRGGKSAPEDFLRACHEVRKQAVTELQGMCRVPESPIFPWQNPSAREAEFGALGAGAGALLLGPVGAVAGGYFGAKEGGKRKRKKKNPGGVRGLSPIQRKVYEYIKVGERDSGALEQVVAMGDAGAQAYWEQHLLPHAREAASATRAFVRRGRKKKAKKKNPDSRRILRNAMKGT